MTENKLIAIGAIGAALAALCCVTPIVPIVLGVLGLGSLTAYVYQDAVLFPIVGIYLLLLGWGLWRKKKSS